MTGLPISNIKRIAQNGARRVSRSSLGEQVKSWLRGSGPADRFGIEVRGDRSTADVVAYFGDGPDQLYQLQQWIPALEVVNESRPVILIYRQRAAFKAAKTLTSIPSVLAISYPDLAELYADNNYRLAIYVNNGMRNFQSMADTSIVHVHVDHGESDKKSSISNQLKAYDKVFVAGSAAIVRCEQALWGLDTNKMVTVGRPPLDGNFESILPHDNRRTVVYAPTWQGENDSNNFTSVDTLGPQIVEALIDLDVRIVYRPHPRVAAAHDAAVVDADRAIRSMLHSADDRGGPHVVSTDGSIMDLFVDTDVLITDVSSVGPDFLFLHPEKGLILTDRHTAAASPGLQSPLATGLGALTEANLDRLPQMIEDSQSDDALLAARRRLKAHYFSANTAGESTRRFTAAIEDSIRERESVHTE
ncbi:CDP-glycerol glycerophosphotransferase family protein [Brevibacterium sp. UCMA 11754]|uniref:CDP-glycerol glycerophosphotransferase family protein n=1 Tax=Brevibacterium sp. UCMA 11754 TaxID=2749198 RepID=UPI001F261C47|nr:CDP-glycerol glycerophosphotransferase family protein [Brevibacterium sp. UCMA 11754]MCF2573877.1 CDP-glycerol glycerophosphotransferase family protein [Brevibacterium sp. UCMA 11754]